MLHPTSCYILHPTSRYIKLKVLKVSKNRHGDEQVHFIHLKISSGIHLFFALEYNLVSQTVKAAARLVVKPTSILSSVPPTPSAASISVFQRHVCSKNSKG